MPGPTGSLKKQVDAAELALRQIARLHSNQGRRPQRIAQQTLQKMTLMAQRGGPQ